jgi:hypothetical protein
MNVHCETDQTSAPIEITVFTKSNGPLTKRISLNNGGGIKSDGSACVMSSGRAQRMWISGVQEFAHLIEHLRPDQAIALGALRSDLADDVEVITKERLNGHARPDLIARTGDSITYRASHPAPVLLDYDMKGMPTEVGDRIEQLTGWWPAVVSVAPLLENAAGVTRQSTSAGISRSDTGEQFAGSGGVHAYIITKDGADAERFLKDLHERSWLAGLGWYMVGAGGQLLDRSIVDRMVGAPERLVFEGAPVLEPPLVQNADARRPLATEGKIVDTAAVCPPLTAEEKKRLAKLKAEARQRLAPESKRARDQFVDVQAEKIAKRTGQSKEEAKRAAESMCDGVLFPDVELEFDDGSTATVAAILANPPAYKGMTLSDPLEGPAYGRCKAKVLLHRDGTPWIRSFAHGLTRYTLKPDLPKLNLHSDPVAVARKLATLIADHRDVLLNGYTPVRVVIEQGQEPRAVELNSDAVRAYAYTICRCVKVDKNGVEYDVPLTQDVARLYLNGLEGEWGLMPLRGISTSPLLSANGNIRGANGYDEETGLWCHGVPSVAVSEKPTMDEAQQALLLLRQAYSTFPFGNAVMLPDPVRGIDVVDLSSPPQLDESTHLAALMTSVCRPCLPLAPGFLYNASAFSGAGTGKGLLCRSTCVVGSGVQPSAMSAGHSGEELDKRLVAAAIEARPAMYLDNFNEGTLESDALASFLTEDPARVRVLGQSKTVPLNVRALVVITGNAVQIAEDIARRVLMIGLDARMENPEQRPFPPGFLQSIFTRRSELLSACLTIWRWGIQQGDSLQRGRPIGSYEQWARWCRDPLLALGCRDPIERLADIKAADPRRRQLIEVFNLWHYHHSDRPVTATELHLAVKEAIDTDARRNGEELQFSRQKVAGFLRAHTNTRAGGFHLLLGLPTTTEQRNQVTRYRLVKIGPALCA